jgi:hypothetical protein
MRRAMGMRPQSESLSTTKPWLSLGMSRRTWERRRKPDAVLSAAIEPAAAAVLSARQSDATLSAPIEPCTIPAESTVAAVLSAEVVEAVLSADPCHDCGINMASFICPFLKIRISGAVPTGHRQASAEGMTPTAPHGASGSKRVPLPLDNNARRGHVAVFGRSDNGAHHLLGVTLHQSFRKQRRFMPRSASAAGPAHPPCEVAARRRMPQRNSPLSRKGHRQGARRHL